MLDNLIHAHFGSHVAQTHTAQVHTDAHSVSWSVIPSFFFFMLNALWGFFCVCLYTVSYEFIYAWKLLVPLIYLLHVTHHLPLNKQTWKFVLM